MFVQLWFQFTSVLSSLSHFHICCTFLHLLFCPFHSGKIKNIFKNTHTLSGFRKKLAFFVLVIWHNLLGEGRKKLKWISFFFQPQRGMLQAHDTSSLPTVTMRNKSKTSSFPSPLGGGLYLLFLTVLTTDIWYYEKQAFIKAGMRASSVRAKQYLRFQKLYWSCTEFILFCSVHVANVKSSQI